MGSAITHTRGNTVPIEYDLTAYEGITPLEAKFVMKYMQCNNAGIAYNETFGVEGDNNRAGNALLRREDIKRAVNKQIASKAIVELGSKETIIAEMIQASQFDTADLYNEDGTLKNMNEMPPSITKFIQSVTVTKGKRGESDIINYKMVDKLKALEQLFKALNIVEFDKGPVTNNYYVKNTVNNMSKEALDVLAKEGIALENTDLVGKREIAPNDFSDVIDANYTEIVYESDDNS